MDFCRLQRTQNMRLCAFMFKILKCVANSILFIAQGKMLLCAARILCSLEMSCSAYVGNFKTNNIFTCSHACPISLLKVKVS